MTPGLGFEEQRDWGTSGLWQRRKEWETNILGAEQRHHFTPLRIKGGPRCLSKSSPLSCRLPGKWRQQQNWGKKFLLQLISICIFPASGELTLSFNEEMYVAPRPSPPLFNICVCELPDYFLELLGKRQTGWVASSLGVTHPFNMVKSSAVAPVQLSMLQPWPPLSPHPLCSDVQKETPLSSDFLYISSNFREGKFPRAWGHMNFLAMPLTAWWLRQVG